MSTNTVHTKVRMQMYMLGPAKRDERMLNEIRDVAKSRPVAMYHALPKVRFFRIECV
jgi:hypothetical protein